MRRCAATDAIRLHVFVFLDDHDLMPEHFHIEARFWTDSRRTDFIKAASTVRIAIVGALKQAGIALPRPEHRQVTIVEGSRDALEKPPSGN